ncbi:MAG: hypothetical protein HUU01_03975 [Saprospiraceae bacterium]|nr:hypothetical protein [Saprospiraceae bacterium]
MSAPLVQAETELLSPGYFELAGEKGNGFGKAANRDDFDGVDDGGFASAGGGNDQAAELFVLTGRVEAEYLRYLERSDYAPFIPTSHADAKEMLATAETFIAKMKEVVKNYPRSASLENESP